MAAPLELGLTFSLVQDERSRLLRDRQVIGFASSAIL